MRLLLTVALILLALLPSAYFFWQARDAPHLGYFQDDALYLVGAKSLAEGHGYKILSLPGEPYQTKYPPLYPALLAIVWKLNSAFPANLPWVMLLQWLLWLAFLATVSRFVWAMPVLEKGTKLAVMAFVAVAPGFVYLSLCLLPETLLAVLVLLTFLLAGMNGRPSLRAAFLGGLSASAAFLTKTAALPLLIAVPVALVWRKQYRQATLFCLAPLTAIAAWTAWVSAHRVQTSDVNLLYYLDYLGFYRQTISLADLPRVFEVNLSAYVESAGRLILFIPPDAALVKILHLVAGLGIVFLVALLLRDLRSPALTLFAALYTAQCLVWNYPPNERFLFPLLVLFVAGFFRGVWRVLHVAALKGAGVHLWRACAALAIGWSLLLTSMYVPDFLSRVKLNRDRVECASTWIKDNIPPAQPTLAFHDVDLFLYSGRHSIRLLRMPGPYYRKDSVAAEQVLWTMPAYAARVGSYSLLWNPDDFGDDPYLRDQRRRDEILSRLPGLVLESDVCGARVYKFTQP